MSDVRDTIIAILILTLCIMWYAACKHSRSDKRHDAEMNNTAISTAIQPAKVYKDDSGHIHYEYKPEQPSKEVVQKLVPFVDSVAKALDIKAKQVEDIVTISTETKDSQVAFLQKRIDSLKRVSYYYKDKYLQLMIKAGNPTDTLDKGSFDFKYDADLSINQYWKRKKFLGLPLGAKETYIDVSSNDPRTTVMGMKKYTVKQKQPEWGLRIQAIQNYSFISNSANTGIRATFDLRHMSFTGGYYYNWNLNQWRPSVSVGYDLIRF